MLLQKQNNPSFPLMRYCDLFVICYENDNVITHKYTVALFKGIRYTGCRWQINHWPIPSFMSTKGKLVQRWWLAFVSSRERARTNTSAPKCASSLFTKDSMDGNTYPYYSIKYRHFCTEHLRTSALMWQHCHKSITSILSSNGTTSLFAK